MMTHILCSQDDWQQSLVSDDRYQTSVLHDVIVRQLVEVAGEYDDGRRMYGRDFNNTCFNETC